MDSDVVNDDDHHHSLHKSSTCLVLDVRLHLGRLLVVTTVVTVTVLALVVAIRHGIELTRFPAHSKSDRERSKLLDDYNSYSGTLATMVSRPLEIVVALLVQVLVVRVAAATMLHDHTPRKRVLVATLALSAGVGYLLNNALNALNVQLRSLDVEPVITTSDLHIQRTSSGTSEVFRDNQTHTRAEATPKNPIANTVLRNLVLQQEAKSPLHRFGLPQCDWQPRVLPESLDPQRLCILINASNTSTNPNLPMPLARAANLFMNGLLLMGSFLPIDSQSSYFTRTFPNVTIETNKVGSAAIMAGALPSPTIATNERRQLRCTWTSYYDYDFSPPTTVDVQCSHKSNSSLLVISVGKRLVADTLVQTTQKATNMRKVNSFTVGRLGWELEDLSNVSHAACATTSQRCLGLRVGLSSLPLNASASSTHQFLVVGADALPVSYLTEPNYKYNYGSGHGNHRSQPVRVHEPPRPRRENKGYDEIVGDILLPHNIITIEWKDSTLLRNTSCDVLVEDRLQLVLKNHTYMEESLQPAYTAAAFFLLQNTVVKDIITLDASQLSLNFDGNRRDVALRLSVPALNAWLTIVGCALLVLCTLTAVVWSAMLQHRNQRDPLRGITTPHAIARVALDESRFPPLKQRVVDASERVDIEQLYVQSLAVTRPPVALPLPTQII